MFARELIASLVGTCGQSDAYEGYYCTAHVYNSNEFTELWLNMSLTILVYVQSKQRSVQLFEIVEKIWNLNKTNDAHQ